jgi:type IV pilus assembly protein PilA
MQTPNNKQQGFTLLEILLVVAAIAILAGIVIVALNPGKQLGDTRNAERTSDVNSVLNAVYQYSIDNNGNFPGGIDNASSTVQVIGTGGTDCSGTCDAAPDTEAECLDLSNELTPTYLADIPSDPKNGDAAETGYYINKTGAGRITVGACSPEQGAAISATR